MESTANVTTPRISLSSISDLRCLGFLVIFRQGTSPPVRKMSRLFPNLATLRRELERHSATVSVEAIFANATVVSRPVEIAAVQNQVAHRMSAIPQTENPKKLIYDVGGPFGAPCEFEQRPAALLIALQPIVDAVGGTAAIFGHAIHISRGIEHHPTPRIVGQSQREAASDDKGSGMEISNNLLRILFTRRSQLPNCAAPQVSVAIPSTAINRRAIEISRSIERRSASRVVAVLRVSCESVKDRLAPTVTGITAIWAPATR